MPFDTITSQADVVTRLRELEDRAEIQRLTAAYNRAFDDMDVEGWLATFVEDATFVIDDGAPIVGLAALKQFHLDIGFGKVHATVDHVIDVAGDLATQTCYLLLGSRTKDRSAGSVVIENSGRYLDELCRTADGWRFTQRTWIPDARLSEQG